MKQMQFNKSPFGPSYIKHSVLIACFTILAACKDFVNIAPPVTEIAREDVFSNDGTAQAAISGIYADMFVNGIFGFTSELNKNTGLASDELLDFTGNPDFIDNFLTAENADVKDYWVEFYKYIYSANAIIEGLSDPNGVSPLLKSQIEGEAKFIRALCHFYLVNLWGDVPLITSTDFRVNTLASRSSTNEIYNQITKDLTEAKELLVNDYSFSQGERTRPNKAAAEALLARVYLYTEDWGKAEAISSAVISNSDFSLVSDLNEVSLLNNTESIWQIKSTNTSGANTFDGSLYILTTSPTRVALRNEFVMLLEGGDKRKANWIGQITVNGVTFFFPFKYKVPDSGSAPPPITEALSIFRLAEQYLIRAEARIHQGNILGAQDDLNTIRNRAGLGDTPANDESSLLAAIALERRVELFTEGSHRWLDLKRTGTADAVLGTLKNGWQPKDKLFPIPESDLNKNPNLTQNPDY